MIEFLLDSRESEIMDIKEKNLFNIYYACLHSI